MELFFSSKTSLNCHMKKHIVVLVFKLCPGNAYVTYERSMRMCEWKKCNKCSFFSSKASLNCQMKKHIVGAGI